MNILNITLVCMGLSLSAFAIENPMKLKIQDKRAELAQDKEKIQEAQKIVKEAKQEKRADRKDLKQLIKDRKHK